MKQVAARISGCRSCGGKVTLSLDLGQSPVANQLVASGGALPPALPLQLVRCRDCGLVQQAISLQTADLFGAEYPYRSSVSRAVCQNAADLAAAAQRRHPRARTALDVGSNDGTTQRAFAEIGIACFGVDPAQAAVDQAIAGGAAAFCGPFDAQAGRIVVSRMGGPVDIVTMSNVLAHVPDPNGMLVAARDVLAPDGLLVIEVQSWRALVEQGAFDMAYHEHHCHFSLGTLLPLLCRNGFAALAVECTPAQGGSLRVWAARGEEHAASVLGFAEQEARALLGAKESLRDAVAAFRASALSFAERMKGRHVAGYGAAAKTVSVLSVCGSDLGLRSVADGAASKVGRFLPVGGIPIISPHDMLASRPDVVILFAWNLSDEILPRLKGLEVWTPMPVFERIQ